MKSKLKFSISSLSLEKFLKSHKNLSKPPPKLFPEHHLEPSQIPSTAKNTPKHLDLDHQILKKLEHLCTHIRHFHQIHSQLLLLGLFQHPLAAGRCIKKLCASLNSVSYCVFLYDHIDEPDAFMCNIIMRYFVSLNDPFGGLRFYYEKMVARGVLPNGYTFSIVGKVCAEMESLRDGQKAHARVIKFGFEFDLFVRNSLMHMYCVCGRIWDARAVFDYGFVLDLVSWNSMIDGYVKNGEVGRARELFDEMPERDCFSWNSMISGCVAVGDMEAAERLFEKMPCRDIVSWNSIIDGYGKLGNVSMARGFFDRMPLRNVVSWNIMLALYQRCKDYGECLKLFDRMVEEDVRPNRASLVSVLTACANFRRLDRGMWVHSYCKHNGIEADMLLSTAFLTMYAKCGVMDTAREIFDGMSEKSVVSWNSLIMGYATHGHGEKALEMFLEMEKQGSVPNAATFVGVLCACLQEQTVLEGWWYFHLMCTKYKIEPKAEHYGCMVDLLGRAGFTEQSKEFNWNLRMVSEPPLRRAPLSANCTRSLSEHGETVAKQLIELYPKDIAAYLLLSNLYAFEGKWDDVGNVKKTMKKKGLWEKEDSSLEFGELDSTSFTRYFENCSFHRRSMICSMLREMSSQMRLCSIRV